MFKNRSIPFTFFRPGVRFEQADFFKKTFLIYQRILIFEYAEQLVCFGHKDPLFICMIVSTVDIFVKATLKNN